MALVWDARLDARGVRLISTIPQPGMAAWRLIRAEWFDEREAGGRSHIFVEAHDETGRLLAGVPFRVVWPTGAVIAQTKAGAGFEAGNFPMSPSRNEFTVMIYDGLPSDAVTGIGRGADTPSGYNPGIHTASLCVFQRTLIGGEPTPLPNPPTPPLPTIDPVADALAWALQTIDDAHRQARASLIQAIELYSKQIGGNE